MSEIKFNPEEKEILSQKIKDYCDKELGQSIGQFEAEFFLDFISAEIGAFLLQQRLKRCRNGFPQ